MPLNAEYEVLLCTDLHAGNILAAEREPWLLIDPKPYVGDPTYDALQHLLNCDVRLHTDPDRLLARMADCLNSTPSAYGCGCSLAASRSQPIGRNSPEVALSVAPA